MRIRARRRSPPNALQHTHEDEHATKDLPAQMAVDQDARTGKAAKHKDGGR
jgi:hypothetical protein